MIEKYNNKSFSLLCWGKNEKNEDDVIVYLGKTVVKDHQLFWQNEAGSIKMLDEWFPRIQAPLNDEIRDIILGAEFFISLRVGTLPPAADLSDATKMPFLWEG